LFPNSIQSFHGIFVYRRIRALARQPENQVEVIAPVTYFPSWLPWGRYQRLTKIPAKELLGELQVWHPRYFLLPKLSMSLHGLLMFRGSYRLAHSLHEVRPFDCIDAHYVYPDGYAAVRLGKLLGLPVFVTARGTDINVFPKFPLIRRMIQWTLGEATGIIAVSRSLKKAMVELGVPAEKVHVIGNGVDAEIFQPLDQLRARQELGLPENAQIILSVGGLSRPKGFHELISAFAQLASRYPRLRLYIIGEGIERANLEKLSQNLGLIGRVILVGDKKNEQLGLWYSAADLMCLASTREGMPNVVLESMACGTPVVATAVGGIPEILHPGETGLLVETESSSIAEGLERALIKPWNRQEISGRARQRTWDVVAAEVDELLRQSTARRNSPVVETQSKTKHLGRNLMDVVPQDEFGRKPPRN
jgi:teichuronic acid biosynthesis glycosyltransferase TuaC